MAGHGRFSLAPERTSSRRPSQRFEVMAEDLLQRHPLTPYLGQSLYGVVEDTWVRGHRALHNCVPSETPCGSILLRKDHE